MNKRVWAGAAATASGAAVTAALTAALLAACSHPAGPSDRSAAEREAPTSVADTKPAPPPFSPAGMQYPVMPAPAQIIPHYLPQGRPIVSESAAKYASFSENPWQRVAESPVSTFSASVDTGSYANVRRFINRGQLPPKDAVRVEELVNYFGFDAQGPEPDARDPFKVQTQVIASPWQAERGLIRIAIKGKDVAKASLPPANLVFLVDVSGSMAPEDRLPLVRSALKLLAAQLRPQDRVSLVTYANGTRVVLPATPGDQKTAIQQAIDAMSAGGGTNGEGGLRLAYQQAGAGFIAGGINRVLIATDGDLNVGVTDPAQLKTLVEMERKSGIGLTTLGVGDDNYNDALMKQLADVGDGSYHYLDSLQEAHKVLVNEMTSTLAVIAKDLKLQVEFNPAVVQEYRLVGYELHGLKREDFNNDQVDASEIGAGHQVTALYEFVPVGAKANVDPLRYGASGAGAQSSAPTAAAGKTAKTAKTARGADGAKGAKTDELAWIKLRYKTPGEEQSQLVQLPVKKPARLPALDSADADTRFAVAVAGWGQWMRGSTQIGGYGPEQFLPLARSARGDDRFGHRAEFTRLAELSASLKR